ncbi:hypothetical protein TVAG_128800 [Trichomonas vaginalis G3]|uniref:Uncharacterized protein n=1 Tax=Trichomonas vaginalis (strain ATCC PRA-98 / G3) TaxID=412133 RepID=A2E4D1_TRIV3|nr:hypothetical protein TVAGG3_0018570 [Trichomonas vaginalis G3]EAY12466.1 hypothetical protein TVAG_128800 [Trichomonas vaginalis G3]KAI5539529.1 hypothetical protein TVAGG3_0018570 [Trichomonas vaginalis G3]|eukprot:XP_001324689.1 hypothetical protein [Trichomonas vaginalis G3]
MVEILLRFEQITTHTLSQMEIVEEVGIFQRSICATIFKQMDSATIEDHFYKIFMSYLDLSKIKSSQVKNYIYASMTTFLMKVCTFYTKELSNAFSKIVIECTVVDYDSTLIVSIFAYMTNYISPEHLIDFMLSTPIFHHFFQQSVLASERLSNIIFNISVCNKEWLEIFFTKYLRASILSGERTMLSASLSVFNKDRKLLIQQLISAGEENNWSLKYISALAYFVSAGNLVLGPQFKPAQIAAFNFLLENTSFSTKTDIFIILSTDDKNISISYKGDNVIDLTYDDKTISFDFTNHINDPTFYSLNLPLSLLTPDKNNLSTVIGTKIETLGRLASKTTNKETLTTIIDLIYDAYTQNICHFTSILRSISKCANNVITYVKSPKFYYLLNSTLLGKEQSWFHSSEILHALQSIEITFYPFIFGSDGQRIVRRKLIKYATNANEQFASEAILFLKILSQKFFDDVIQDIWFCTDFFDKESVHAHLKILNNILENMNRDIPVLNGFIDCLYELYEQFDDIEFISDILIFLSHFDHSNNKVLVLERLIDISVVFIHYGIQYLTGEIKSLSVDEEVSMQWSKELFQYIGRHPVDITDKNSHSTILQLRPVYSAARLILNLKFCVVDRKFLISACIRLFRFYPDLCTNFMAKNFREFTDEERVELVSSLHNQLYIVSSPHVHAKWAEIALYKMTPGNLPRGFLDMITRTCLFFIKNHKDYMAHDLYSFAGFLGSLHEQYRDLLQTFLVSLPHDKANVFIRLSKKKIPGFVDRFENEFINLEATNEINKNSEVTIESLIKIPVIDTWEEKIAYYSAIGRSDLYETCLIQSYIKKTKIDFSNTIISSKCALPIFNFVYKLEKNQIQSIEKVFSIKDIENGNEEGCLAWALYNIDDFIKQFLELEKIKKDHLLFLCKLVSRSSDNNKIREILLPKILNLEFKKKKLHFALYCVLILAHSLKNTKEMRDIVFLFMRDLANDVDQKLSAKVLYSIVAYAGTSHEHNKVIKRYFNEAFTNPVNALYFQTKIILKARKAKRANTSISDIIIEYLNSDLPSSVMSSVRLAYQTVYSYGSDDCLVTLKNSIQPLIDGIKKWLYLPPIAYSYSKLLNLILKKEELRYLHNVLLYSCFNDPISFNNPSELVYAMNVTEEAIPHANVETSQFEFLFSICQLMLSFKNSKIFEAGTRCYTKVLQKNIDKEKMQEEALIATLDWMSNNVGFDHYKIMTFVESWRKLMMECSTVKKVGEAMAIEFVKHATRMYIPFLIFERCLNELAPQDQIDFKQDIAMGQTMIDDESLKNAITSYLNGDKLAALDLLYQ